MDIKLACENYWVDKFRSLGVERVFAGRCDDEDPETPLVICRCEEAPSLFPGSAAHRADPFEVLIISSISDSNSLVHSNLVALIRNEIETIVFPDSGEEVIVMGRGSVTIAEVETDDDERYADILSFPLGIVSTPPTSTVEPDTLPDFNEEFNTALED